MKMRVAITIFCLNGCFLLHAQQGEKNIKAGNDLYKQKKYEKAIEEYEKVLKTDSLYTVARFNIGNAQYRLNKKDEANTTYSKLLTKEDDPKEAAALYYNGGVVLTNQQKPEESIKAYKNALRQNPDDKNARENLQKALLELKSKTPPPQKDEKKKKQQQQSKINPKEAQQQLKQLEQKEKQVQQRMQNQRPQDGSQRKDW